EFGVFVSEFDSHCFAIHQGQLMAKLVADVAAVPDLMHRAGEVSIVLVRLARYAPVYSVHAGDAAFWVALKLSAEMRHDLHGTDRSRGLANGSRTFVRHQRGIETDLEMW